MIVLYLGVGFFILTLIGMFIYLLVQEKKDKKGKDDENKKDRK